jgi:hypothetical protein
MVPVGYMAKRVPKRSDRLQAPHVVAVFSVSNCNGENFTDYIPYWKDNGYWLFDSPEVIRTVARENSILLAGTSLGYYEAYEKDFDGERWTPWSPEPSFRTDVLAPSGKQLAGFDAVSFTASTSPECSGLSCSSLAADCAQMHTVLTPLTRPKRTSVAGRLTNPSRGYIEYSQFIP